MELNITQEPFGETREGLPLSLYTLRNRNGMTVKITNYGGIITELHVPDKHGRLTDVTCGYARADSYFDDKTYFGSVIGRYGNRIASGRFQLDGETVQLDVNDGENHLHGGPRGFNKMAWHAVPVVSDLSIGLQLTCRSRDGDQGYPGNVDVTVNYELNDANELLVKYHAITDKATPINLTHHAYFNLAGEGTILDHQLVINAERYTPIDSKGIPLGPLAGVAGTPFDFRTPHTIGERINDEDEQLDNGLGYDHNFVLSKPEPHAMSLACLLREPESGRVLEIHTQEPGLQFYSGNFLDGALVGKGWQYTYRCGVCLEPQHFPDSPNQPDYPDTILRPGQVYETRSLYRFTIQA